MAKKIQARNAKQRSQSKFLKKAPDELARIIETVNLVPPDYELPDLSEESKAKMLDLMERDDVKEGKRVFNEWCRKNVGDMPASFLDYLHTGKVANTVDNSFNEVRGFEATYRYIELREWRDNLRIIAKTVQQAQLNKSKGWSESSGLWLFPLPLRMTPQLFLDGDMKLLEKTNYFIEIIRDVELERIRECAACRRIFWAGRLDAQQCGRPKCKSVLSTRFNRNPELREQYNKARRTKRRKQKRERSDKKRT